MAYVRTNWVDYPNLSTPINAARLNNMEAGIAAAIQPGGGQISDADIAANAAIQYSKLALTGHIVDADIASNAAIQYAKLALALQIVNGDISPAAAIAISKLAGYPGDVTQVLHGDGSWAQLPSTVVPQKILWGGNLVSSLPTNLTWTANMAALVPFTTFATQTADRVYFRMASVASGNYDVGIYDSAGNLKVSKGSTPMSGLTVSVWNEPTFTVTTLAPGQYYCALAINNATAQVGAGAINDGVQRFQYQVAAAFPLPATIVIGSTHPAIPFTQAAILA